MIISASRRTDIPAFFPEWCLRRFEAGRVLVRHPMNRRRVTEVPLVRRSVDCIVFWTKDPRPMLPELNRLDGLGHHYYFLFTVTPYGSGMEPRLAPRERILAGFKELSQRLGRHRVLWRYDPIILSGRYSFRFHVDRFAAMAEELKGQTDRCIVSFLEPYAKIRSAMQERGVRPPELGEQRELLRKFAEAAGSRGITLYTCAGDYGLENYGVRRGKCIDDALIGAITGRKVSSSKDPSQRPECGCVPSRDIGAYNTCLHGCRYCYAAGSSERAQERCGVLDPDAPLLGAPLDGSETVISPGAGSAVYCRQPELPGLKSP
jgi:hypothetical protein